jgi:hypothetical protein
MWDKNRLTKHGGGLLALALVACGGSDERDENGDNGLDETTVRSFEGLYRLDSFSENASSCDVEGPSTLATITETNFVMVGGAFFGARFLQLASCSDANCAMKTDAIRTNGFYSIEYSLTLSGVAGPDELTGFRSSTGFGMDDICVERDYVTHVLTRTGDSLRVESRTVALEDAPQEDGFCVTEPAKQKQEAEGRPCTALSVFTGTKTSELP